MSNNSDSFSICKEKFFQKLFSRGMVLALFNYALYTDNLFLRERDVFILRFRLKKLLKKPHESGAVCWRPK